MNLVYLGFGIVCGIAIGYIIRAAIDPGLETQNRELRAALARVLSALIFGHFLLAQRECEMALGDEAA